MGWGMSVFPDDPPASARLGVSGALRSLALLLLVAVAVGSATALFLWSLDQATLLRHAHPGLLWLLPLAGLGIGLLYHYVGGGAEGGNNRVIQEIHEPVRGVPRRMAPWILLTTVITHLFGGSAGREGTAVQMGAGIANTFARTLRRPPSELRTLLLAGVAAGFGAVFGTPLAGTVFALEVLVRGRLHAPAFAPCLLAALVGDWTCRAWGIVHTPYVITAAPLPLHDLASLGATLVLAGKVALAAAAFGLVAAGFARACQGLHAGLARVLPWAPLRPVVGGIAVILLVHLLGTRAYLGLGVSSPIPGEVTISSFFAPGDVPAWAWFWKLAFTALTLGAGFKGGEVTPLFFIGAALGHTLAGPLGVPPDLLAGLGLVAIFAAATHTPLASTLLGLELFGPAHAPLIALACLLASRCTGRAGIYTAQR